MDVLIVDGDAKRAEALVRHLSDHGIRTQTTNTGQDALARSAEVDAVLLSPKLPDTDGLEACRAIRSMSNVPILMVSEEDDEIECILALKLGADDYIPRPFRGRELIARVQAVVRRAGSLSDTGADLAKITGEGTLRTTSLRIDLREHQVRVDDCEVYLTCKEFDLLALLATEPGRVFSSEDIMLQVWGHDGAGDTRTLRVHVSALRKKLKRPGLIETVRGVGFRLARQEHPGSRIC